MSDMNSLRCKCLDPQCGCDAFHETDIGVHETEIGVGNVSLFDCRFCGHRWLHYVIGDEAWKQSSRWYRGPISMERSKSVTPETATEIFSNLPWYFYGGHDFDTNGTLGDGPIPLELDDLISH